jgi:hypothetical protein
VIVLGREVYLARTLRVDNFLKLAEMMKPVCGIYELLQSLSEVLEFDQTLIER